MTIINLTPHSITIFAEDGETVIREIPASGLIARVTASIENVGMVDDIPVTQSSYSDIYNLPDPVDGVVYVVSALVAERAHRADVLIPNEAVRDSAGRIIGCKSLGRI